MNKRTIATAAAVAALSMTGLVACVPPAGPGGSNHPDPCPICHGDDGPTETTIAQPGG
jgi:hypothetical protein